MSTDIKNIWHSSISRGNAETSVNCYGNAILLYNQALDHALYTFNDTAARSVDQAISQVLIARFSLADCYKSLGMYERVAGCYISAAKFLVNADTKKCDREEMAMAVMHAFHHCNVLWMEFLSQHRDVVSMTKKQDYSQLARQITQREVDLSVCH